MDRKSSIIIFVLLLVIFGLSLPGVIKMFNVLSGVKELVHESGQCVEEKARLHFSQNHEAQTQEYMKELIDDFNITIPKCKRDKDNFQKWCYDTGAVYENKSQIFKCWHHPSGWQCKSILNYNYNIEKQ